MADEPAKSPIQNKYAQQYADDLAANRQEQGDITAQIADLKERLQQLQTEENWLAQAQGSLLGAPVPNVPGAQSAAQASDVLPPDAAEQTESATTETVAEAPQAVPQQRQDRSAGETQPRKPGKKAAAKRTTAKKTSARKTSAKATGKKAAAKRPSPKEVPAQTAAAEEMLAIKAAEKPALPLWQLVLDILRKTPGQPCVAKEVHERLAHDYPDRATSVQTVRNNLETLVKKGLTEKSNQQGSAMYTAYKNAGADAVPPAANTMGGAAEQIPEAADERVPTEV
ncbi:hypothetical protein LRE75_34290 [Streptomyces sp. 372A]